jgi:putative ABC transport system ATP-binding protein
MVNVLQVNGLRKNFESEGAPVRALRGVDLTVDEGEFVAVMGPSGCGRRSCSPTSRPHGPPVWRRARSRRWC